MTDPVQGQCGPGDFIHAPPVREVDLPEAGEIAEAFFFPVPSRQQQKHTGHSFHGVPGDVDNLRVGVRASDENGVGGVGKAIVVDIISLTHEESMVLDALYRPADVRGIISDVDLDSV